MDPWIHRSAIVAKHAAVSSDQPAATSIGLDILKLGGNAADAAVATMAAVSVIQPMTCGIGGDCQCLFYNKSNRKLLAINGSGRNGENATLDKIKAAGIKDAAENEFANHGLWVSVPGAVAGMFNVIKHFGSGKLTMNQILDPAIKLAEEGVPVPRKTAEFWEKCKKILAHSKNVKDLFNGEKPPTPGQIFFAPKLAHCLKAVSAKGAEDFYCGDIAYQIVQEVQNAGGELTLEDMAYHLRYSQTSFPSEAVYIDFHGFKVWEMKPNAMGIIVLVALNVLKLYDLKALGHNSAEYIHFVVEVMKYATAESWEYLCDPEYCVKPLDILLSTDTAEKIKNKIHEERASENNVFLSGGNTSYVAAVDEEGNGCSFICSVSGNFGTGLIPNDCGFVLHDRAKCMSLDEGSPNVYGPKKFPLHTIIPSIVTDSTNELLAVLGVIGRWMQPQGQVQVILNMIVFGMDPQTALNQRRFCIGHCRALTDYKNTLNILHLEEGIEPSAVPVLRKKGHDVCAFHSHIRRRAFGVGHVIARPILWNKNSMDNDVWWAGAEPRSDGCAMGY